MPGASHEATQPVMEYEEKKNIYNIKGEKPGGKMLFKRNGII